MDMLPALTKKIFGTSGEKHPGRNRYFLPAAALVLLALAGPRTALAATPTLSAPTIYWTTLNRVVSATDTSAKLGATIDADGGAAITERGIVWSTTDTTPTIGEPGVTKVAEGSTGTGVFSLTVGSLPKASLVYFSGYATNAQGTGYSAVSSFHTEPDAAPAPTVNAPSGTNYFDLTVNYTKPANADGVLVVARQSLAPKTPPYDGLEYTADARLGSGDSTDPGCVLFCEYVVAQDTASGSVTVTGLKDDSDYYFIVYAYKGSGAGETGINYVQTITAAGPVTTDIVPAAGKSHNELYVAQGGAGGAMTSADCANCHGVHHTSQLLPTGLDMYNKCFVCHQAGGAADPKIDIGMHLADGSVDCGTCHTMHSFREEELYSTDHSGTKGFNRSFVRANMAKYLNTTNGFTVDALEPTVFQNRPGDFAFQSSDPPYNAVCQTCHSDDARTSHHQQDATDDHQFGNDCITCHSHKNTDEYNAFKPSAHPVDFGKDASCTVCHDPAGTKNVLADIHGDGTIATCSLCHAGSPTRNNEKLGDRGLGDARNADGTAAASTWASQTCVTCHDVTTPDPDLSVATLGEMHHGHADATGGNCVACHMPNVGAQSPLANRSDIMMPANLACNWCHLWWPNNTDYINQATDNGYDTTTVAGKVMIYRLTFDPVTNQRQMATIAPLPSHAISENTTTPINDYGACFACHGATGVDNGRSDAAGQADMVRPFHGLGQPVTSAVAVDLSGSNADYTRHVNNFYAGPQQTTANGAVKTIPYNPGYAAFNFLALDVGSNQGGNTKPYATDDKNYKFIHDSERNIRGVACRNTTIGSTTASIEYNNWGADLGAVGSITVNVGGVMGSSVKSTVMPLVNLSLPASIGPQPGCP
ncbi:MAG: hypothetical protein Kow0089_22570 [Desulfobulbaceae bacterium]